MKTTTLKEMLSKPGIIEVPGAYDAWTARLVEQAGFPALYMTGYGTAASVTGLPDIGLITLTEMAIHAKNICQSVNIPVIADADTGYGNILNVIRTVREYENSGVAAIQFEDQVFPKRCGHMEGKVLVSKEEMVARVKAAVDTRKSEDFLIVARTDARAVNGLDDAIERAQAYLEAGADIIFVEAPQSVEEMKTVAEKIKAPLIANMVEEGKTPILTASELEAIGYKIVIYPSSAIYAATRAVVDLLQSIKENGSTESYFKSGRMVSFKEFNELIGVEDMRELEKKYLY